jgi:nucleoside-diphosphate-sugar epimerase
MRVVIPGGTGQVGTILDRALTARGHDVVVLTRHPAGERHVYWDGRTPGDWMREIDGCDLVVNLAGRSVSCRYTPANLEEMMRSRVDSARAVGRAVAAADRPPRVWMQMSTATVYAHRFDAPNDEATGRIGGDEPGMPGYWEYSVRIARRWEAAQEEAATPATRKVALRSAMVMRAYRSACRPPGGWPGSGRSCSARTPSCCSRAAASSRDGSSTPGSRSLVRGGRPRRPTWSPGDAGARADDGPGPASHRSSQQVASPD